jgi:hypothetical protein
MILLAATLLLLCAMCGVAEAWERFTTGERGPGVIFLLFAGVFTWFALVTIADAHA